MSRALNDVLESAFKEAENFKDEYVSTEHMFLAIAAAGPRSRGAIAEAARCLPRSDPAGAGGLCAATSG